jgi:uncharacterized protein (TIGR02391 family)
VYRSLPSLVPDVEDLLALDVEEIAEVLLMHLISSEGASRTTGVVQLGKVNRYNFCSTLHHQSGYSTRQDEVARAMMEAWSWLESEGFLVPNVGTTPDDFFFSRRARLVKSPEDFDAYRKESLLPRRKLHERIAAKVYPAFLRGEYDTAVFQAFREVEIAVRSAGGFGADDYGVDLMRRAFRPVNRPEKPTAEPGALTDKTLPVAEQEGMRDLFVGAIALFKNPPSHRIVAPDPIEGAEVIVFASHLMRMVDRLRPAS